MFTVFHGTSGFLITLVFLESGILEPSSAVLFSAFIFSMLPDIDILLTHKLKDHHKTLYHSPLFWISCSAILSIFNFILGARLFFHTFFHLFNDYVTGKTTGIFPLYPFSMKEYSLFPVKPSKADFTLGDTGELQSYVTFYFRNKYLLGYELLVGFSGLLVLFLLV